MIIECSHCPATVKVDSKRGRKWNVDVVYGQVVGYRCPPCQTAEQNAEAEINLATIEYGRDDEGRLIGRPKL